MNLADAAERILREQGEGRPMHYRTIAERAIDASLIAPRGLTPEASLNAAITTDIARRAASGEGERFLAYGRGLYGLARQRVTSELEEAVRRNNSEVRERLLGELREMDPWIFEDLVGRLLDALGFVDVEVTARSGDGGVDVRGTLAVGGITNVRTAIQVKRWAKNVSGRTVRELRGGLSPHERGLIITTSGFTRDAGTEADATERTPISLVDGDKLVGLLIDHGIGVVRTDVRILRIDPAALLGSTEGTVETDPDEESGEPVSASQSGTTTESTELRRRVTRHASGKNLSLWPLPGGQGNYVQSMSRMLTFVSEAEPTLDELIDWILETFPTVRSRKSGKGYIEVPRLAGLIETRSDRLVLTTGAATYLASADSDDLFRTVASSIAGLEETLDRVREEPIETGDVTKFLNQTLGTAWETDAQATWRLRWLESFGKITRSGDRWVAKPA